MNKILIADDAIFMRMMIRDTLRSAGFTKFVEAESGEEAVRLYKWHKPDLVLLDITIPEKGGLTTLSEIMDTASGDGSQAKVVMCCAMGQESMVIEAIGLGALDFIVKPFKPERLIYVVRDILG